MSQNQIGGRKGGCRPMDEGIPISAWQEMQINQVLVDFLGYFLAGYTCHSYPPPPSLVVRTPTWPTPRALRDIIEKEVQQMLRLDRGVM